ncbi:MAG: hypothetical protein KA216_06640 [Giesbergeria sp.]|nr:hypothetical protein [Giesbergeria sp.]
MNDFAAGLVRWLVKAVLFVAGVVLFLSLLAAALLLALVWGVRALWARLSGRPVVPWTMRFDPRQSWSTVYRSQSHKTTASAPRAEPFHSAKSGRRMHVLPGTDDVVDVQPRAPRQT